MNTVRNPTMAHRQQSKRNIDRGPEGDQRSRLVLTRRINDAILIGEGPSEVLVRVVLVDVNRVRLAIEAPRSVRVDREEARQAGQVG